MNIILGSANFTSNYSSFKPRFFQNEDRIKKLLFKSSLLGINQIDTAQSYSNCEQLLGSIKNDRLKIDTKINIKNMNIDMNVQIENSITFSLHNLKSDSVNCIYIHDSDFVKTKTLQNAIYLMEDLKQLGLMKKIGLSIYNPDIIKSVEKQLRYIDVLQCPLSVIDQRILKNEYFDLIQENNINLFARSIFLQGLLLDQKRLKQICIKNKSNFYLRWEELLKLNKINATNACMNFIKNLKQVKNIVVGVMSYKELHQIYNFFNKNKNEILIETIGEKNNLILEPWRW